MDGQDGRDGREQELFTEPEGVGSEPRNWRDWERPTAWLLGTQLFTSLRDIILSGLYDFDPRDWMNPGPPEDLTAMIRPAEGEEEAGAWLDFLADTGDSPRLVYQLAYLLLQERLTVQDAVGAERRLPRGDALIFGGDTAYPVSDYASLVHRVRDPMIWAYRRLQREEKTGAVALAKKVVPLFGIPANHDYYNALRGFVRGFRKPLPDDPDAQPVARRTTQLGLPGYQAAQEASYFALKLPYEWQLWGLDVEGRALDERQARYFRGAGKGCTSHIVVTSQPAVVYHHPGGQARKLGPIFQAIGLAAPFREEGVLAAEKLQLDLSGDIHLYERYWGSSSTNEELAGEPHPAAQARPNYASVVSGLGGAFHHPSQVRRGTTTPQRSWPPTAESAAAIGGVLLRPRKVFQAGAAGLVGALLAAIVCSMSGVFNAFGAIGQPLDAVTGLPDPSPKTLTMLWHLGLTTLAIVATVAVGFATRLALKWTAAWRTTEKQGSWLHRLAYHDRLFWTVRWAGVSRQNLYRFAKALPIVALLALLAALVVLFLHCVHVRDAHDGRLPFYLLLNLFALGLATLSPLLGGGSWPVKLGVSLLGALTGLLLLWTPYVWTLLTANLPLAGVGALLLATLWLVRQAAPWAIGFSATPNRRRLRSALVYLLFLVAYAALPAALFRAAESPISEMTLWRYAVAVVLGGYFTCQWVGWYFLLALQWNSHGNEAGVTARVDDYAAFLRIKLTRDKAEVWAIAAVGTEERGSWWSRWRNIGAPGAPKIEAKLVDHFVIERKSDQGSSGGV